MKYTKTHLSPELRAQITPHNRRDVKLTVAGVIFLLLSAVMVVNLWPTKKSSPLANNKPVETLVQSDSSAVTVEKQVLGESTSQDSQPQFIQHQDSGAGFTQYTVKNGDTLFNISQKYNVKWDLIASVNGLAEPYILHAGLTLKIPQATTSQVPNKIYTIKPNDTLANIAKQFNITVADIVAVNPNLQKSDLITVGQVIKLP